MRTQLSWMVVLACAAAICQFGMAAEKPAENQPIRSRELVELLNKGNELFLSGRSCYADGKNETGLAKMKDAAQAFIAALKLAPDDEVALNGLGSACLFLNLPDAALKCFTALIERETESKVKAILLGRRAAAYAQLGNREEAFKDLNEAEKLDPESTTIKELKAAIEERLAEK
ncbi:MAG: tetratricopeptide repeat protein [Planctomycetes bacterium]|nr:tetratricopeptide repeat protein [Planctomycetota bacterium]